LKPQAFFASCPRGLESLLAGELRDIGASTLEAVPGGVAFQGDMRICYRANLESRLATRVLARLARTPYRNEQDVYEAARAVRWLDWLANGRAYAWTSMQSAHR
jgi:putative N6-adenine-specific DNA methylase